MSCELDFNQALDELLEAEKGDGLGNIDFVITTICERLRIGKNDPRTQEVRNFIKEVHESTIDIPTF